MKHTIQFKIVTPEKIVYSDDIDKVTIPTKDGEITVLANHSPLISILKTGEMKIVKDDNIISLSVSTGFVEIRPNSEVYILADTAERAEDIDIERAKIAKERVEKMLKDKSNINDINFAALQASLNRELTRIKIANKYRKIR